MLRKPWILGFVLLAASLQPVHAQDWKWRARFTDASSEELTGLHGQIHSSGALAAAKGVAVKDVTFESEFFSLHMTDGAIYLEPEIEGTPFGAFFVGTATVSFTPNSRKARGDLVRFLGKESLEQEPIGFAHFFTLAGSSLLDQLGIEGGSEVPFESRAEFEGCKKAMRQQGAMLTHAFLNRAGRAKGTVHVLFAPESIRGRGSSQAYLLYSLDPNEQLEVQLSVFGHEEALLDPQARQILARYPDFKYRFWPISYLHSEGPSFVPHGNVDHYTTRLSVGRLMKEVEEETTIIFTPTEGASALQLELTPRLEVESVTGPDGDAFPFLQWSFLADQINSDERVVVWTGDSLEPGETYELKVVSRGPLFDAWLGSHVLAEEDIWHPRLNDPEGSTFELFCSIPSKMRGVAAGKLLSEEVTEGKRNYHFLTSRPNQSSTFYFGNFQTYDAKADETNVQLLYDSARDETGVSFLESPKYTVTEIANAVKIYNRILAHPLELDDLRVAATPTSHGRGFEGLILLSKYGGTSADSSSADLFRAHEVAHQWWGNMVQPRNWPEDRWLSESFAEYSAMEYFQLRFKKPDKTRQQIRELWVKDIFKSAEETVETLTGEKRRTRMSKLSPLIAGDQNVYTKGPLVLHMLRYLFQAQKKSDEGFWLLLQDFLEKYKYEQASTKDFMQLTEQHLEGRLDWFWDQWIYGTDIPVVRWSHDLTRSEDGGWLLTVEAEQADTSFVMPIPIYVRTKDGKTLTTPLVMRDKHGKAQVRLRDKPARVSLNDNYEALIEIRN